MLSTFMYVYLSMATLDTLLSSIHVVPFLFAGHLYALERNFWFGPSVVLFSFIILILDPIDRPTQLTQFIRIASVEYGDTVKRPNGEQVHDIRDKTSDKHEFVAYNKGVYRFCFANKSPYHENIDFDVHAGHFLYHEEHAKDEHFKPLFDHIGKLEGALYNVQFEQHWLQAQNHRQAIVNEKMGRGAVHKAIFESAFLVGASILQVYIMRRLFEKNLRTSRV